MSPVLDQAGGQQDSTQDQAPFSPGYDNPPPLFLNLTVATPPSSDAFDQPATYLNTPDSCPPIQSPLALVGGEQQGYEESSCSFYSYNASTETVHSPPSTNALSLLNVQHHPHSYLTSFYLEPAGVARSGWPYGSHWNSTSSEQPEFPLYSPVETHYSSDAPTLSSSSTSNASISRASTPTPGLGYSSLPAWTPEMEVFQNDQCGQQPKSYYSYSWDAEPYPTDFLASPPTDTPHSTTSSLPQVETPNFDLLEVNPATEAHPPFDQSWVSTDGLEPHTYPYWLKNGFHNPNSTEGLGDHEGLLCGPGGSQTEDFFENRGDLEQDFTGPNQVFYFPEASYH